MGDLSDMKDLDRFLRSKSGRTELNKIRAMLKGKTITKVMFSNEILAIATTITFDTGDEFVVFQPSLNLDVIRMEFADMLEREYRRDHRRHKSKCKPK